MKKTVTINLNGIVFHIDEDAYNLLHTYLQDLSHHFSQEEGNEIMKDIEARIAELFQDKINNLKTVITIDDVNEVINTLGHPSDFDEDNDEEPTKETIKEEKKSRRRFRHFYRDPENSIIAGICSGLAAYINWDVTLVRIIFIILPFIGFGFIIPIYFILWLLTPAAITSAQRLEMMGKEPSVENIKNYVENDQVTKSNDKIGNRFFDILRWIFKALFIIMGCIIALICFFCILMLLIAIISIAFVGSGSIFFEALPTGLSFYAAITLVICAICICAIPLVGIIISCVRLIQNKKRARNTTTGWILFSIWLVALIIFIITFIASGFNIRHLQNFENYITEEQIDQNNTENLTTEVRVVDPFKAIKVKGNIKLIISQNNEQQITISAPTDDLEKIVTTVQNGILTIKTDKQNIKKRIYEVHLSAPNINAIEANKAAYILNTDTLSSKQLTINATTAANVNLTVNCTNLIIDNNNASAITIKGTAHNVTLDTNNASSTNLTELNIVCANIESSNASNVQLHNVDNLELKANNGSNVSYDTIKIEKRINVINGASYKKNQ